MIEEHRQALVEKNEVEKSLKVAKAELKKHKAFVEKAAESLNERDKLKEYVRPSWWRGRGWRRRKRRQRSSSRPN